MSKTAPSEFRQIAHQVGATIRALRLQRQLSQEKLAELAGLHRNYYGGIERGERNPSLKNLLLIATALNVPIRELFPQ